MQCLPVDVDAPAPQLAAVVPARACSTPRQAPRKRCGYLDGWARAGCLKGEKAGGCTTGREHCHIYWKRTADSRNVEVCVCVFVCARACARARVCVRVCARGRSTALGDVLDGRAARHGAHVLVPDRHLSIHRIDFRPPCARHDPCTATCHAPPPLAPLPWPPKTRPCAAAALLLQAVAADL